MSDQSKLGLGQIITTPQERDAIHIAIMPIIAEHSMKPGDHVGINAAGQACKSQSPVGIVDPFLRTRVASGETFWLYIYPGTITSLKHLWSHPGVPEVNQDSFPAGVSTDPECISKRWLEAFAESVGADYDQMMYVAETHCRDGYGDYLCEGGRWEGQGTPDEFWTHYTNVTGKKPDTKYGLPGIFSCSC